LYALQPAARTGFCESGLETLCNLLHGAKVSKARWVTHPSHKLVPCETPGIWHLLARYGAIIVPELGAVWRRARVSREIGRGIHQFYPRRRREHRAQVADRSQKNQTSNSHLCRCRDCVGLKVRGCQRKRITLTPTYLDIHDIPPNQSPNIGGHCCVVGGRIPVQGHHDRIRKENVT
jgi:hypothetical protein